MGSCKCPSSKITATDWHERFIAATCVCRHNGRLHAEENGRKIEVCGDSYANIDKVKVDGGVIPKGDTECCDFFFGHRPNHPYNYSNNAFVELKGCKIGKAFDQIVGTVSMFRHNGKLTHGAKVNGVIVCSRVPKAGGDELRLKKIFKRDHGGTLFIKANVLKYDIANNRIAN